MQLVAASAASLHGATISCAGAGTGTSIADDAIQQRLISSLQQLIYVIDLKQLLQDVADEITTRDCCLPYDDEKEQKEPTQTTTVRTMNDSSTNLPPSPQTQHQTILTTLLSVLAQPPSSLPNITSTAPSNLSSVAPSFTSPSTSTTPSVEVAQSQLNSLSQVSTAILAAHLSQRMHELWALLRLTHNGRKFPFIIVMLHTKEVAKQLIQAQVVQQSTNQKLKDAKEWRTIIPATHSEPITSQASSSSSSSTPAITLESLQSSIVSTCLSLMSSALYLSPMQLSGQCYALSSLTSARGLLAPLSALLHPTAFATSQLQQVQQQLQQQQQQQSMVGGQPYVRGYTFLVNDVVNNDHQSSTPQNTALMSGRRRTQNNNTSRRSTRRTTGKTAIVLPNANTSGPTSPSLEPTSYFTRNATPERSALVQAALVANASANANANDTTSTSAATDTNTRQRSLGSSNRRTSTSTRRRTANTLLAVTHSSLDGNTATYVTNSATSITLPTNPTVVATSTTPVVNSTPSRRSTPARHSNTTGIIVLQADATPSIAPVPIEKETPASTQPQQVAGQLQSQPSQPSQPHTPLLSAHVFASIDGTAYTAISNTQSPVTTNAGYTSSAQKDDFIAVSPPSAGALSIG